MGWGYFSSENIRDALLSANENSSATAALVAEMSIDTDTIANLRTYREGFRAALCTLALAFGLSPSIIAGSGEQQAQQVANRGCTQLDNHL